MKFRRRLLVTGLCSLLLLLPERSFSSDAADSVSTTVSIEKEPSAVTPGEVSFMHPVLLTRAGQCLKDSLSWEILRELSQYPSPYIHNPTKQIPASYWRRYFEAAEGAAAEQFCKKVVNERQGRIIELIGKPIFSGVPFREWTWCKDAEEVSIYEFGGLRIPVFVLFKGGKCMRSGLFSADDFSTYVEWKGKQIVRFSQGKDFMKVIEEFGCPDLLLDAYNHELSGTPIEDAQALYFVVPGQAAVLDIKARKVVRASFGLILH